MKSKIQKNQILIKGVSIIILAVMILSCLSLSTVNYAADDDESNDSSLDEILDEQEGIDADDIIENIEESLEEINTSISDINSKLEIILGSDTYKAQEFIATIEDAKSGDEIPISAEYELRALSLYVAEGNSCKGLTFNITNNINLKSGGEWDPIGSSSFPFSGTLNGYGHTISGMILTTKRSNVGLVGYLKGGKITNIKISDSTIAMNLDISKDGINDLSSSTSSKYQNVGAIVGYAENSKIIGCINNVNISGGSSIGGIVGYLKNTSETENSTFIQDCINNGDIIGYSRIGGIVGKATSTVGNEEDNGKEKSYCVISRSINNGNVYAYYIDAGGIVGLLHGTVSKCENSGNVSVSLDEITVHVMADKKTLNPQNAGGIAGSVGGAGYKNVIKGSITNEDAKIFGYKDIGGIVGQLGNSSGGYSIARESISYCKYIDSKYVYSSKGYYSMGAIAGQVGSSTNKQTGRIYNCYYVVIQKDSSGTETIMKKSEYTKFDYKRSNYFRTQKLSEEENITILAYGSYVLPSPVPRNTIAWKMFFADESPTYPNGETGTKLYVEGAIYDWDSSKKSYTAVLVNGGTRVRRVLYNLALYRNKIQWNRVMVADNDAYSPEYSTITVTEENVSTNKNYQPYLSKLTTAFGGSENTAGYSDSIDSIDRLFIDLKVPSINSVSIKDVNNSNAKIFANNDILQIEVNFDENLVYSRLNPSLEVKINNIYNKATFIGVKEEKLIYQYKLKESAYIGSEKSENNFTIQEIKLTSSLTDVFGNKPSSDLTYTTNLKQYTILNTQGKKSVVYKNSPEGGKPTFSYQFYDSDPTQSGQYRSGSDIAYDDTTGYIKNGFSVKITSTENIAPTSITNSGLKLYVVYDNGKKLVIPYVDGADWIKVGEKRITFCDIGPSKLYKEKSDELDKLEDGKVKEIYLTTTATMVGMDSSYTEENTVATVSSKINGNIYLDVTKPTVTLTGTDKTNYTKDEKLSIGMTISDNYILGGFITNTTLNPLNNENISKLKLKIKFGAGDIKELIPQIVSQDKKKLELKYDYTINSNDEGTLNIEGISYDNADGILIDLVGNKLDISNKDNITNNIKEKFADTTVPTVNITSDEADPTNANTITYTFDWSEEVTEFEAKDITIIGGKIKEGTDLVQNSTDKTKYTLEVTPNVVAGNEGQVQVIVEANVCKDAVGLGNLRTESTIKVDKKAPTLTSYNVKKSDDGNSLIVETIFDEAIGTANKSDIEVKFGEKPANGTINDADVVINKNDKRIVTYTYNISGADEGTPTITLKANAVKDIAGNLNSSAYTIENKDIVLEKHVIKIENDENDEYDEYSFSKNNTVITNFANPTYFKAGDIIKVTKVGGSSYTYTVEAGKYGNNTHIEKMTLTEPTAGQTTGTASFSETSNIDISAANIYFDTTAPRLTTKVYAENGSETTRYSKGTKIIIETSIDEKINANDTNYKIPEIQVNFSQSGAGKYNFTNGKEGYAKYEKEVVSKDGKITYYYSYVVENGDEGTLSIEYKNGNVTDLAGNSTDATSFNVTIPSTGDNNLSDSIIYDSTTNTTVSYETYKNNSRVNDFNTNTYFKVGDKIKVKATINKTLYTSWQSQTRVDVDKAPKLDIKIGNNTLVSSLEPSLSFSGYTTILTYEYTVNNEDQGGKITGLELSKPNTYYAIDAEHQIGDISANTASAVTISKSSSNVTTDITNCNLFIDTVNLDGAITINPPIYVDTTVPTVNITAKKVVDDTTKTGISNNITNADKVEYTFTWSEEVTGFTAEDVTVNNGNNITFTPNATDKKVYTMTVDTTVEAGNVGDIQVIVEKGACQDIVGYENVRTESVIRVDKQAPILLSLEAYANSSIGVNENVDTVKEYYKVGDTVTIFATFSENIASLEENITGLPKLALQFSESGNAKGTVNPGKISGNKITYTYSITDEDNGILSVKGFSGTVLDAAGNKTIVTKRNLNGDTIIADTKAPTLVGITAIAPNFEYDELLQDGETKRYGVQSKTRTENTITIIAEYSENVYNLSSNTINKITDKTIAPTLALKFSKSGNAKGQVDFEKVEGSKIYYKYDITSGDNGDLSIVSLSGTVSNIAGNTCTTGTSLPTLDKYEESIAEENEVNNITADTKNPTFTITATAVNYDDNGNEITENKIGTTGYYRKGSVITIKAETNENEYVYKYNDKELNRFAENGSDAPQLNISFSTSGNGVGICTNVEYTNNQTIFTYTYIIKENDNGILNLNIVASEGYDIALNGNDAKTEPISTIVSDTVRPQYADQPGIEYVDNKYKVTFNENLYYLNESNVVTSFGDTKQAPLLKFEGQEIVYEPSISGNVITYAGNYINAKPYLGASRLCDKAGNLYAYYDQEAPKLLNNTLEVISPETGTYKAGQEITIVATFNEKVTGIAPTLQLQFSKSGDAKGNVSTGVIEENTITYTYTITATDAVGNGDNGKLSIKSFTGTGLKDLSDNLWVPPTSVTLTGNTITADTIAPTLTITSDVERTNKEIVTYTFTWSESVTGFTASDIEVTNGSKSEFVAVPNTDGKVYTLKVDVLEEGRQIIKVNAGVCVDVAGNENLERVTYNKVVIDYTKPVIRAKVNGGNYVLDNTDPENKKSILKETIVVDEELSSMQYVWSASETVPEDGWISEDVSTILVNSDINLTKEIKETGTYYLYIKAKDIAGNTTEARTKAFVVKTSKITLTPDKTEATNQDITVTVAYGEGLTENRKAGVSGLTQSADASKVIIAENGTVYAEATDKAGNKVCKVLEIENIDKVAPEGTITYVTNEDKSVTATISFNEETVITNNEGKDTYVFTKNGEFIFEFKDLAGNRGTAKAVVASIKEVESDKTAPTITFNYTSTVATVNTAIGATITTDEDAIISYSWDNKTWISSKDYVRSQRVVKTPTTAGSYTLYAKAADKSGNTSKVQTIEFTVVENPDNIKVPEIIFEDLPTIQVDGIKYVKVSADMTAESITGKMNKDALCEATPKYTKLTSDNKLKTGSEITINDETKYVIVVNGDTNCDGKVSPIDVTTANSIRLNKVKANIIQKLAADFDLDGVIKPIDITMINSYRLGKIKGI